MTLGTKNFAECRSDFFLADCRRFLLDRYLLFHTLLLHRQNVFEQGLHFDCGAGPLKQKVLSMCITGFFQVFPAVENEKFQQQQTIFDVPSKVLFQR